MAADELSAQVNSLVDYFSLEGNALPLIDAETPRLNFFEAERMSVYGANLLYDRKIRSAEGKLNFELQRPMDAEIFIGQVLSGNAHLRLDRHRSKSKASFCFSNAGSCAYWLGFFETALRCYDLSLVVDDVPKPRAYMDRVHRIMNDSRLKMAQGLYIRRRAEDPGGSVAQVEEALRMTFNRPLISVSKERILAESRTA